MQRLTERNECGDAYYPQCFDHCMGEGASEKCNDCEYDKKLCDTLAAYEDTRLTPPEIRELAEAVKKLDNIFGDNITVNQVIDFFVDFYIAHGDDNRVEAAVLLTNEKVAEYKQLKERDTAKAVQKADEQPYFRKHFHSYTCPVCHKKIESRWKFCGYCGQRLKKEN